MLSRRRAPGELLVFLPRPWSPGTSHFRRALAIVQRRSYKHADTKTIVAEYTFNKDGRGIKQILEKHQSCETRVVAEATGGRLHIKEKVQVKCPDGRGYIRRRLCVGRDQTASCGLKTD